jgi:hypothetical protein
MKKLNSCIKIIAQEAIAGSRLLLINKYKLQNSLCLTIVLGYSHPDVQDKLFEIDNVTGFNAFYFLSDDESDMAMLLLLQRLNDDNIDKINNLLE